MTREQLVQGKRLLERIGGIEDKLASLLGREEDWRSWNGMPAEVRRRRAEEVAYWKGELARVQVEFAEL